MPIHLFKTNEVYDLPTGALLRIWFAQFWRFVVLFAVCIGVLFIAAMLTYAVYGIFSDSKPDGGHIGGKYAVGADTDCCVGVAARVLLHP